MKAGKILVLAVAIILVVGMIAIVASADNFSYAQSLVKQGLSCSELNQTQLVSIGDYYMSQIFSPEQHEYIDNMMGGDSSPMAENMHLSFAYRYYCNVSNSNYSSYGYPMMGVGYGYGMMSGYGYSSGYASGQRSYSVYSPWYNNFWIIVGLAVLFAFLAGMVMFLALKLSGKRKKI